MTSTTGAYFCSDIHCTLLSPIVTNYCSKFVNPLQHAAVISAKFQEQMDTGRFVLMHSNTNPLCLMVNYSSLYI